MRHRAVGLWGGFLLLGATALLGAMLLVSGPATAATCPYGPCTQPTTVTPTTVSTTGTTVTGSSPSSPSPSTALSTAPTSPSSPIAFTGAELALMFTIGAIAIGVGGMLVLVTRRRRSQPAYERSRGRR